jgi:hypothetical protein
VRTALNDKTTLAVKVRGRTAGKAEDAVAPTLVVAAAMIHLGCRPYSLNRMLTGAGPDQEFAPL